MVLAVSCTSAQADVLSEANNLGYIAEEIRLQMEQGFKFAIGVTEVSTKKSSLLNMLSKNTTFAQTK